MRNKNIIIICICFIFIFSITIGYAVLSEQLNINSMVTVRSQKDIRITSLNGFVSTNEGYEIYVARYNENQMVFNIALPNIESNISYNASITNYGNTNMKVKTITNESYNNNAITYYLNGVREGDVITNGETINFNIVFEYDDNLTTIPSNNELGAVISFEFEDYVLNDYVYEENGLILNLMGLDQPVNNIWYDRVDNKPMYLTNALYNSERKSYSFNSNSFGTMNIPIIPETGDFTLETYIKTPNIFLNNADEAIIAQVSDSENDTGRFKLNIKYNSELTSKYQILAFINSSVLSSNVTFNYTILPVIDTDYLLQLVRINDEFKLYLNGIEIFNNTVFSSNNTVSQGPFKIGKWNTKSNQPFTGQIFSIRVYNRALTDQELNKNKNTDYHYYQQANVTDTIKTYAVNYHLVDSGSGLYHIDNEHYIYKGNSSVNNYVKFAESDDLYRIIAFENNDVMKLINVSKIINRAFDESGNRTTDSSSYCTYASTLIENSTTEFHGCNAWNSNSELVTPASSGNVVNDSSILTYLNNDFYNSLPISIKNKIIAHNFYSGLVEAGVSSATALQQIRSVTWNGKIGLVSLGDVLNASLTNFEIGINNTNISNYFTFYTGSNKFIWTMTGASNNTWDVWTLINGAIGKRRASRTEQEITSNLTAKYYVFPVFYTNSDVVAAGNGSLSLPFIIPN